jgi:hypothetical protein
MRADLQFPKMRQPIAGSRAGRAGEYQPEELHYAVALAASAKPRLRNSASALGNRPRKIL